MEKTNDCKEAINEVILRIDHLRSERGMSINTLAERANLSEHTIKYMFRRKYAPSLPTLFHVCSALDIDIWQLFFHDDEIYRTETEKRLLYHYRQLNEKNKDLLTYIASHLK